LILFGSKGALSRRAGRLQVTALVVDEVSGKLRKASDDRGQGIAQISFTATENIRKDRIAGVVYIKNNGIAREVVVGRVSNGFVERVGESGAIVFDQAHVSAKPQGVIASNPRYVVHKIVDRRGAA